MNADNLRDAMLDQLLAEWWQWLPSANPARGYSRVAAGFDQYRCSRQYDDANGALDSDLDSKRMQAVDRAINNLESVYRAALADQAWALTVGRVVQISPRLPADKAKRGEILREGRGLLLVELVAAGVM